MMQIEQTMTIQEKLRILSDAAKYDAACTSSGVDRRGKAGSIGNSLACGICHSFSSDGRCISLLKILLTNECVFDCKYCINRSSNDVRRAAFTPDEVCSLTIEFYRRNYIEGLFLSSGVSYEFESGASHRGGAEKSGAPQDQKNDPDADEADSDRDHGQ